ncbi:hypothetical protein V9T40_008951 [Parthenolecanium corni]|uniref:Uncharacterized protein n=1 Tax=Parthenolecanium corni TaxID=536013 RepID=A0AAN9TRM9_9HEMI
MNNEDHNDDHNGDAECEDEMKASSFQGMLDYSTNHRNEKMLRCDHTYVYPSSNICLAPYSTENLCGLPKFIDIDREPRVLICGP